MDEGLTYKADNPSSDAPFEAAAEYYPSEQADNMPGPAPRALMGSLGCCRPAIVAPTGPELTMKPLSEMTKQVTATPWADDGTVSTEYFKERVPPPPNKLKNLPVIGAQMQEKNSKLKNVELVSKAQHVILRKDKGAGSKEAQLSGAIGRLASVDAEVSKLMADTMAVARIEEMLGPEEQVLAKLPCVGFDGFPDFAISNNQQRIGDCSVSLIGSEKDPHCPLRMVFSHHGQLRSIEADEQMYKLPLIYADSNTSSWTATREQSTAMAAVHVRSQLVGITSDNVEKVGLRKSRGYNKPWWIGTIFTLILIGILFWFKTFIGAALDNWYPPVNPKDGSEWVRGCTASEIAPSWVAQDPAENTVMKIKCFNPVCLEPGSCLDDGSCIYVEGCTDPSAPNYQPKANKDDGSCEEKKDTSSDDAEQDEEETTGATQDDNEEEESECPDSPGWTGDQYIWFFAWFIKIPIAILFVIFLFKRGWSTQVSFHANEVEGERKLLEKIRKNETFKTGTEDSLTTDIWEATLFSSRFQGVNICLADPYNDEAREVVCVVDSTVPTRDIGRFILMADAAKMDRSSKDSRNLKFLGGNRRLHRAAGQQNTLMDSVLGDTDHRLNFRKLILLALFILACWGVYQVFAMLHGHASTAGQM